MIEQTQITSLEMGKIANDWLPLVSDALDCVDIRYLQNLQEQSDWLPGPKNIFNAFTIPLAKTRYILLGESPYPRSASANGYAFWDAAVHELWSNNGLSTAVNRATSLRNIIKMLLLTEGLLDKDDLSQSAISHIDKTHLISTIDELFGRFIHEGFLLLNASLVLSNEHVRHDAKAWLPFMTRIIELLVQRGIKPKLLLFGKIAEVIKTIPAATELPQLVTEHPYNLSFIQNPHVLNFFGPLHLLQKKRHCEERSDEAIQK